MPGRSLVCFSCIYRNLTVIMMRTRYGSLGILGHSLRNKIPIVSNYGEGEMGSMEGWKRKPPSVPQQSRWGQSERSEPYVHSVKFVLQIGCQGKETPIDPRPMGATQTLSESPNSLMDSLMQTRCQEKRNPVEQRLHGEQSKNKHEKN